MAMQISGVTIQGGMNILPAGGSPSPSPAPTPAPSDPNFSNVVFLFDGDGTNGADNNTFTDSSTNGFTVTESGSVVQGSFSPYGDNWSNYFDGNDHLNTTAVVFGTNNFTIEAWVMFDDASASQNPIIVLGNDGYNDWQLDTHTSNIRFQHTSGSFSGSTTLQDNTWYHVAVVREGTGTNQIKIYLNGALEATSTVSENFDGTGDIKIARNRGNSYYMSGYVSNVRLVNGTAVYTSTFTPSTSPLTAITNTELLTCQSNRFIDNSSSGHTITVNGTPKVTPFSPFKDSDARSLATDGGSAYFDISNQSYLSYAGGSSTVGDITVSGWVYVDQSTGVNNGLYPRVFASGGTQFLVYLRDGAFRVYNGGEVLGAGIHSNTWYHFVVQRTSNIFELWLNGESQGTGSNSTNIDLNTTNYVGTDPSGGFYGGYLTDLKVTEASEGYSGNFTPPTAPLTAIANTELLLNFQDAAIFDYSGINNIDTIGAQITTAVKKFGTGSVEFNGTSDYLNIPNKSQWDLSSADFTIEAWAYADTLGSYNSIVGQWPNGGGSNSNSFVLETVGSEMRFYFCSGTNVAYNSLGAISTGSWDHWAVTREGTTLRGFKNGTLVFTNASFGGMNNAPSDITVGGNVAGAGYWDGYIDDLRITKGVARYTSNFTAPTAAFPTS